MRKIVAMALVALATAVLVPASAIALPGDDVNGPPCANVLSGTGGYAGTRVGVTLQIEAATCRAFTYSLIVLDDAGDPRVLDRVDVAGDGDAANADGTDSIGLEAINVVDDAGDNTVCVYVETSAGGGNHVFDRAPDADAASTCETVVKDGGGQFGGFS